MLEGVKSTTSEAASARARVARVREKVEARIDEIRILEKERDVKQGDVVYRLFNHESRIPKLNDVAH